MPSLLQALAGALRGLSILYSLRRKSLPSDAQMQAFLMSSWASTIASRQRTSAGSPSSRCFSGWALATSNASLLRKLRLKHTPEGSVTGAIKLSAFYGSKTNCRKVHYDYENWPKRAKTKTWSELVGLGLTEGQICAATDGRPDRNKQWFLRVETESQDNHKTLVIRYTRGKSVYKRNPACR